MAVDDAGYDVSEVGMRVDAVELAVLHEGGDDGPLVCAAGEMGILQSQGQGPDRPLYDVVVRLDANTVENQSQPLSTRVGLTDPCARGEQCS